MSIQRRHLQWKQKFNKLDSNHRKDFTPMEIDDSLNEAQLLFVEAVYSGKQIQGFPFGFEVTQQRMDILSNLVVSSIEQPPLTPVASSMNIYEYDLNDLEYSYMHAIRIYISNDGCPPFEVHLVQHDDLNKYLKSENWKPSSKWKRALATISKSSTSNTNSSLIVYSDLTNPEVQIEYIKLPKNVFFGNYDTLEYWDCDQIPGADCSQYYSNISAPQDLQFPDWVNNLIVDLAVLETYRNLLDQQGLQLFKDKIIN